MPTKDGLPSRELDCCLNLLTGKVTKVTLRNQEQEWTIPRAGFLAGPYFLFEIVSSSFSAEFHSLADLSALALSAEECSSDSFCSARQLCFPATASPQEG